MRLEIYNLTHVLCISGRDICSSYTDIETTINTAVSDNCVSQKSTQLQTFWGKYEGHVHMRGVMSILITLILYAKVYVNRIDLKIQPLGTWPSFKWVLVRRYIRAITLQNCKHGFTSNICCAFFLLAP